MEANINETSKKLTEIVAILCSEAEGLEDRGFKGAAKDVLAAGDMLGKSIPCSEEDLVEAFWEAAYSAGYEEPEVRVAPLADLKVKWVRTPAQIRMDVPDYLVGVQYGLVADLAEELLARIRQEGALGGAADRLRRACCTPEFAARWQATWAERKGYRPAEGVEVPEGAPEGTGLYMGHTVDSIPLMRAVVVPAWLPADEVGAAVEIGVEELKGKMAELMEGSD